MSGHLVPETIKAVFFENVFPQVLHYVAFKGDL